MAIDSYYDSNKDQIKNCEKESLVWWHEKGHQYLRKQRFWDSIQNIFIPYILLYLIVVVCAKTFEIRSYEFFCLCLLIITFAFDEIFAWIFAFLHYRVKK